MKRVHVVGGIGSYELMFIRHGWETVNTIKEADLVQFCGGPDIWPGFYKEKKIEFTHIDLDRDTYEKAMWKIALAQGCAIAGICRGAQFVHAMNGGSLYQHVDNHLSLHSVRIIPKFLQQLWPNGFIVSSTHHQMMKPRYGGTILLDSSIKATTKYGEKGLLRNKKHYQRDIEAVYYEETRSLCYQPHPEYFESGHPCNIFYFQMISKLLFLKKKKENV